MPVQYYSKEYIGFDNDTTQKYLENFSVKVDLSDSIGFHEVVLARDEKTGEMKIVRDEFVFYKDNIDSYKADFNVEAIARYDASSKEYKLLKNINSYEYPS